MGGCKIKRTGRNFLIGYVIGRVARKGFDRRKEKRDLREIEKRRIYREVYGEEAYNEKYVKPNIESETSKHPTKYDYFIMEYLDQKKSPFITLLLVLFTGTLGYLYLSAAAFAIAFTSQISIVIVLVFLVAEFDFLVSFTNKQDFMIIAYGILLLRFIHMIIAATIATYYNKQLKEDLKKELEIDEETVV